MVQGHLSGCGLHEYILVFFLEVFIFVLVYTGLGDAGLGDAGLGDAGLGDAGLGDAGLGDAGLGDAGLGDAGLGDTYLGRSFHYYLLWLISRYGILTTLLLCTNPTLCLPPHSSVEQQMWVVSDLSLEQLMEWYAIMNHTFYRIFF